jgi:hypothetical protein
MVPKILPNERLVQAGRLVQELGDGHRLMGEDALLLQQLDALVRLQVELHHRGLDQRLLGLVLDQLSRLGGVLCVVAWQKEWLVVLSYIRLYFTTAASQKQC